MEDDAANFHIGGFCNFESIAIPVASLSRQTGGKLLRAPCAGIAFLDATRIAGSSSYLTDARVNSPNGRHRICEYSSSRNGILQSLRRLSPILPFSCARWGTR